MPPTPAAPATMPTAKSRAQIQGKPSPARIAANRRNAQKSTGPKTEEGKARSRGNALKHGLTGAGIALPSEDAAQVEARFEAVVEEFAPQTTVGLMLAHDIALSYVRIQRAARFETAILANKQRHAAEEFRQARLADAEHHIHWLAEEPATHRRRLLMTPEGCDRLIAFFEDIRSEIHAPDLRWNYVHGQCLRQACGRGPKDVAAWRGDALALALDHDPSKLSPADREAIDRDHGGQVVLWARPMMAAFLDEQIAIVRSHCATLDAAAIEQNRAEAADRALFDPSREAALARRYEGAARRSFYKALQQLPHAEAGLIPDDAEALAAAHAPGRAAQEALDAGDATPERDPADESEAPQVQRDYEDRPPLGSFGITTAQASFELSFPHADLPMIPLDQPLPVDLAAHVRAGLAELAKRKSRWM